jgi:hypothetical protein
MTTPKHLNEEVHRGLVPTDQLGAGAADATVFLRGDQAWAVVAGAPPTGAAGGDLAGTYPNPTVAKASLAFALTGDITAGIGGGVNDWAPAGLATASWIRISGGTGDRITGLTGGSDGRIIALLATAAADVVIVHEGAGSAAANRFDLAGARDLVLPQGGGVVLIYDAASSRWRPIYPWPADLGGYAWKLPVAIMTTSAGTLASDFEDGDTVNGYVLSTGDRILIKDQADPAENGIYVVEAAGAPTRATDANTGAELVAAAVSVNVGGSVSSWVCTVAGTPTLGTSALPWVQLRAVNGMPFPVYTVLTGGLPYLEIAPWGLGTATGERVSLIGNDATGSGTGGRVDFYAGSNPTDSFWGAGITAGPGAPGGHGKLALYTDDSVGNAGDVLTSDGADTTWEPPSAYAPTDADYLVGTAQGGLSAEIVVGTTPGGELGGTWAAPTVDETHSGSAHHDPVTVGTGLDVTGQLVELDLSEVAAGGQLGGFMDAPTVDSVHAGSAHHLRAHNHSDILDGWTLAPAGLYFPVGSSPLEEGRALWDSATDVLWIGTGASPLSVIMGSDIRLTDARTPTGAAGGELGGTYPSPTVDSVHAGSAHHAAVTLAADADALLGLSGQQVTLDSQAANVVLAGPASGGAVDPTFRSLVDADIPAAIARDTEVTTAVSDHAGAADPHSGYRLESADHTHASSGLQAGQVAHSALSGIGAADHHDPVTVGTGLDVTGQLVELDLSEVAAGGELGGFLDAPTVDTTHSGSSHASVAAYADSILATHEAAGDPHVLTVVEKSLGSAPVARRSGSFQVTGLAGLTAGKPVTFLQAQGPYTGKGTRADEAEMDAVRCSAYVLDATTIQVYWETGCRVRGNVKFAYLVGG